MPVHLRFLSNTWTLIPYVGYGLGDERRHYRLLGISQRIFDGNVITVLIRVRPIHLILAFRLLCHVLFNVCVQSVSGHTRTQCVRVRVYVSLLLGAHKNLYTYLKAGNFHNLYVI